MSDYITLAPETLPDEHICCAISDKKCVKSYLAKKNWLASEYNRGYRFHRLDERGKVFIEYGPGEAAWMPIIAPEWMIIGCFWVSGKFKQKGHGKALLSHVLKQSEEQGLAGLATVVGSKKMHFMSDGKWLQRQGFKEVDKLENGFSLIALSNSSVPDISLPKFSQSARDGVTLNAKGVSVYYSNRCPFSEYHVLESLRETCAIRELQLHVHKLDTLERAQNAPSPATIFSLYLDGQFITTDISVCMTKRFDKIVEKALA